MRVGKEKKYKKINSRNNKTIITHHKMKFHFRIRSVLFLFTPIIMLDGVAFKNAFVICNCYGHGLNLVLINANHSRTVQILHYCYKAFYGKSHEALYLQNLTFFLSLCFILNMLNNPLSHTWDKGDKWR